MQVVPVPQDYRVDLAHRWTSPDLVPTRELLGLLRTGQMQAELWLRTEADSSASRAADVLVCSSKVALKGLTEERELVTEDPSRAPGAFQPTYPSQSGSTMLFVPNTE